MAKLTQPVLLTSLTARSIGVKVVMNFIGKMTVGDADSFVPCEHVHNVRMHTAWDALDLSIRYTPCDLFLSDFRTCLSFFIITSLVVTHSGPVCSTSFHELIEVFILPHGSTFNCLDPVVVYLTCGLLSLYSEKRQLYITCISNEIEIYIPIGYIVIYIYINVWSIVNALLIVSEEPGLGLKF